MREPDTQPRRRHRARRFGRFPSESPEKIVAKSGKGNVIITLSTNIVLFAIMFIGLLRLGFYERGTF